MKILKKYSLYLGCLLLILLIWMLISLNNKNEVKSVKILLGKKWPKELYTKQFKNISKNKLIFVFSSFTVCDECILTHLRLINEITRFNSEEMIKRIYLIGLGKSAYDDLMTYKKILNLKPSIIYYSYDPKSNFFSDIKLPIFMVLNNKNIIVRAWEAESLKIHQSVSIIKNYFPIVFSK